MDYPNERNTSQRFADAYEELYKLDIEGGITCAVDRFGLDTLGLPTEFANHPAGPAGLPVLSGTIGLAPLDMKERRGRGGMIEAGPNFPSGKTNVAIECKCGGVAASSNLISRYLLPSQVGISKKRS